MPAPYPIRIDDVIPPPTSSHLTCKAFQLQPAPRPRNALRKQASKDSSISKASSFNKTCGSGHKSDASSLGTANLLVPADFREAMPASSASDLPSTKGSGAGEKVGAAQDAKASPSSKFTERFSIIEDSHQASVREANSPTPSISEAVLDGRPVARWKGALPYRPPVADPNLQDQDSQVQAPVLIRITEATEDLTGADVLKSSATAPPLRPARSTDERRGDGWGGLRAPASWFETTFVPGPLATPTPSVVGLREQRRLYAERQRQQKEQMQEQEEVARRSGASVELLSAPARVRRSLRLKTKGAGMIASIVSMEVPPIPGVPFRAIGGRKGSKTGTEGGLDSAEAVSGTGETRIRWADDVSPGEWKRTPAGSAMDQGPTSPPSSSLYVLHKGKGDTGDTALDFSHLPIQAPSRTVNKAVDEEEDDAGWKERLVAAVQAAMRQTAATASDVRASLSAGVKRDTSARRSLLLGSAGAPSSRQPLVTSEQEVELSEIHSERAGRMRRTSVPASLGRREAGRTAKAGDSGSATVVLYGSDWAEGRPALSSSTHGRASSSSRPQSARSSGASTPTSLKTKQGEEKGRRNWKQAALFALLVFLLLALLSNLVMLNIKVLSKSPSAPGQAGLSDADTTPVGGANASNSTSLPAASTTAPGLPTAPLLQSTGSTTTTTTPPPTPSTATAPFNTPLTPPTVSSMSSSVPLIPSPPVTYVPAAAPSAANPEANDGTSHGGDDTVPSGTLL
ncbi:hypothetical protein OC834_004303 [Tilletia horrida]|nr:hypothetical protein OC834_004303 [Tilletia horrida]KAK0560275.1 hypothetical protein OC844_003870 [Tilletia horrida]